MGSATDRGHLYGVTIGDRWARRPILAVDLVDVLRALRGSLSDTV